MVLPWVEDEMETAELQDKRLNHRLKEVLSQLGRHPTASIPAACGGHAEMTATYRLFDNDKTTFDAILQPHADATRQRMASQPVVLMVQDTTEVDVTRPEQQMVGAGPLDGGSRWGALLHPLHAFTPDGTPLGTIHAQAWSREEGVSRRTSMSRSQRASTPIEEKESYRWVEALGRVKEESRHCPPTQFVCVADSEADIYEFLVDEAVEWDNVDWIVRAGQDRALQAKNKENSRTGYIREHLLAQPVLFSHAISVRGRKPLINGDTRGRRQARKSRQAEMAVRATQITLRPPWRADRKLPPATVNAVLVSEIDPPRNDEPVEWLLLTSLPIDDVAQIQLVIQYYCTRWMIEVFFRVLKSGCRVEERRFEHMDRFMACLAVYLIVAWRTLYVCRLGRSCPDISCESVFEPAEWKSVWKVVNRSTPPSKSPKLGEMVRLVAQLGGYVYCKRGRPPGPQTIWIGIQRTHDFALCWKLFGPETRDGP